MVDTVTAEEALALDFDLENRVLMVLPLNPDPDGFGTTLKVIGVPGSVNTRAQFESYEGFSSVKLAAAGSEFQITHTAAGTGVYIAPGINLIFNGLATTDPAVAGALWNDAGTLKISAG